jgi:TetR/AcrR family transcriptional repressor of nem operon
VHENYPAIREACAEPIRNHVAFLAELIRAALADYPIPRLEPESLATHMQAVTQGAFVMAKATQHKQTALDCLDHLHRYLELLFQPAGKSRPR